MASSWRATGSPESARAFNSGMEEAVLVATGEAKPDDVVTLPATEATGFGEPEVEDAVVWPCRRAAGSERSAKKMTRERWAFTFHLCKSGRLSERDPFPQTLFLNFCRGNKNMARLLTIRTRQRLRRPAARFRIGFY